jgi:hypothetical protein
MDGKCISDEMWREYEFGGTVYRIDHPRTLFVGNTTHRVVDDNGVVHCVPAPGVHRVQGTDNIASCVLRWHTRPGAHPVAF